MSESINQVILEDEKYGEFFKIISIFKDLCNDVDIRNGSIRQKSNSGNVTFELDITSMVNDLSIPLSNLPQKLELFKSFLSNRVTIESNDDNCKVSDAHTSLAFKNPSLEYFDNKYISREALNTVIYPDLSDLILNVSIGKVVSDRIRTISKVLNISSLKVDFDKDVANIDGATASKDLSSRLISQTPTEREIEDYYVDISVIPFLIDHDGDVSLRMYEVSEMNMVVAVFTTFLVGIEITMYCRSKIMEKE
jgi:hypothetical protein